MRPLSVRVRLFIVAAVVAVSVWAVHPPAEKINLGLDLKGGIQLVLRVRTDDALRAQTQLAAEQLQQGLAHAGVRSGKIEVIGPSAFTVADVETRKRGAIPRPAWSHRSNGPPMGRRTPSA
jgi:preprotein translocase subunit SecD